MNIELSKKEFRRLLDLVYIGNWILNSTRGSDRIADYDQVESKLFGLCWNTGVAQLVEKWEGIDIPSRAFADGGIHEAIMDYEDTVFFEILAEELARIDRLTDLAGISRAVFGPVLKATAIGLLTQIAAGFCRDAGEGALAGALELGGVLAILYVSLPLFSAVLDLLGTLMEG